MGIPTHGVFAVRKNARVLGLVFAAAVLVGALGLTIARRPSGEKAAQGAALPKTLALPPELVAQATKDSDGDGLKDWEEAIWRTDSANADSDGDGTPDGEEVTQNRDPAKAGPDDRYAIVPESKSSGGEGGALEQNLTARIGTKISAEVLNNIAAGQESNVEALASAYTRDLGGVAVLESAPRFSIRDLTPAKENDLFAVAKFLAAIEQVWLKHFQKGQPTDAEVFLLALQNQETGALASDLQSHADGYRAAIETVRKTPVPKDLESFAVSFLNFLSKVQRSAELMQGFASDPLAALLAVQERVELNKEFDAFIASALADTQSVVQRKIAELAAQQKR